MEYSGDISPHLKDTLKSKLEEEINRLIKQGSEVKVQIVPYSEIASLCGGKIPSYLPKDKEARIVTVSDLGCPCGGTHIKNIQEIQGIVIRKITAKKGKVRISYELK